MSQARFVALLGLMGVGKTTVGRELARRLHWPLSDSDEQLEARTGQTARELKLRLGADALHELEAEHLLSTLAAGGPAVVCAAASVVDREDCRDALCAPGVLTVWLEASPAALARRFASDPHRPSYGPDPADFLAAQLLVREARFGSVARLTLDAAAASPARLADDVIAELRGRAG